MDERLSTLSTKLLVMSLHTFSDSKGTKEDSGGSNTKEWSHYVCGCMWPGVFHTWLIIIELPKVGGAQAPPAPPGITPLYLWHVCIQSTTVGSCHIFVSTFPVLFCLGICHDCSKSSKLLSACPSWSSQISLGCFWWGYFRKTCETIMTSQYNVSSVQ